MKEKADIRAARMHTHVRSQLISTQLMLKFFHRFDLVQYRLQVTI